jgi:predicted nucleic acid-binding protein
LIKLQIKEVGSFEVQTHATTVAAIYCAQHGRAEFASAAFRKVREGVATQSDFHQLIAQMKLDVENSTIVFLPLTNAIIDQVERVFATAPHNTFLRAADALHLATASTNGFTEVFSNDKHLLAAAPLFGLRGLNVIPATP